MDSLFHRIWECEACREDREELVDAEVIMWAKEDRQNNAPYLINFLIGAFAHPGDIVPPPSKQLGMQGVLVEHFEQGYLDSGLVFPGPENVKFQGSLFLDGSCFYSKIRELSRAGWAFVMMSAQGHMLA